MSPYQFCLLIMLGWLQTSQGVDITVSSSVEDGIIGVFYDGVRVHYGRGPVTLPLRQGVGLLAVSSEPADAAFIAKTTDGFVTDSSNWRCTSTHLNGLWSTIHYDDSDWPAAEVVSLPVPQDLYPAVWINASLPGPFSTFCRSWYGDVTTTSLTVSASTGSVDVRYDGRGQRRREGVWTIPLPPHVTVIGSQAWRGDAVILATSDGFTTGTDGWLCHHSPTGDWDEVDYDDSNWQPPVTVNLTVPPELADTGAVWIKPQGGGPDDRTSCRGYYTASPRDCETGWLPYGSYCYYFASKGKTYSRKKSKKRCVSLGGELASIHSHGGNQFIKQNMERSEHHWLGLKRDKSSSNVSPDAGWQWLDGSAWDWSNWKTGFPQINDRCTIIKKKSGLWKSLTCRGERHLYICKKNR